MKIRRFLAGREVLAFALTDNRPGHARAVVLLDREDNDTSGRNDDSYITAAVDAASPECGELIDPARFLSSLEANKDFVERAFALKVLIP